MKIAHVLPVKAGKSRVSNIREKLTANLSSDTELDIITYDDGPPDLEYYCYEHLAISLMLEDCDRLNKYDAISIACFYDPGVRELREALDVPVIGLLQSSLLLAQIYGHSYSVVVGRDKHLPKMKDNVFLYGYENKISKWQSLDMTVQELKTAPKSELLSSAKRLITQSINMYKSEVVILGCGALSGLENDLYQEFQIPIINPIVAGIKMAETLGELKETAQLSTSKLFDYENKFMK